MLLRLLEAILDQELGEGFRRQLSQLDFLLLLDRCYWSERMGCGNEPNPETKGDYKCSFNEAYG